VKVVTPPWKQRAQEFKSEIMLTSDVDRRVQGLNDQILGLVKDIKLKERALQEAGTKVELLESRMENMKKQAEVITQLEKDLARSQQQEKQYEEALESLQADLEALEQENAKLKANAGSSAGIGGGETNLASSTVDHPSISTSDYNNLEAASFSYQASHYLYAIPMYTHAYPYPSLVGPTIVAGTLSSCRKQRAQVTPLVPRHGHAGTITTS
jgi:TolA-binding protein